MILLLQCPKCRNKMRCQPTNSVFGKRKQCVYCGFSFNVSENIVEKV